MNWSDAYVEVLESSVPMNSNFMTSHVVYKVMADEHGDGDLKSRIFPLDNRDDEKTN